MKKVADNNVNEREQAMKFVFILQFLEVRLYTKQLNNAFR